MYGSNPSGEAAVAAAAVREGAQCLVIDAEGTVAIPNLYGAAQQFVGSLRATLGGRFPIGLAGQAETLEHPTFPYSVFLGPGGFDVVMPLIYWADFGQSVDAAYSATMGANALYGRPILPAGQLYGSPSAGRTPSLPGSRRSLRSARPQLLRSRRGPATGARHPRLAPPISPTPLGRPAHAAPGRRRRCGGRGSGAAQRLRRPPARRRVLRCRDSPCPCLLPDAPAPQGNRHPRCHRVEGAAALQAPRALLVRGAAGQRTMSSCKGRPNGQPGLATRPGRFGAGRAWAATRPAMSDVSPSTAASATPRQPSIDA